MITDEIGMPLWQQNFIFVGVHSHFLRLLQNRINLCKNLDTSFLKHWALVEEKIQMLDHDINVLSTCWCRPQVLGTKGAVEDKLHPWFLEHAIYCEEQPLFSLSSFSLKQA